MRPALVPLLPLLLVLLVLAARRSGSRPPHGNYNFRYERLQNYGLGKRVIPEYWRARPRPQPLRAAPTRYVRPPYSNLYQGVRRSTDRRVYVKKFNFAPKPTGHSIFCQAIVACKISHVAVEAQAGAPVLLRGGAGHTYFKVLVKAGAGVALRGSLSVYCRAATPPPPNRSSDDGPYIDHN